jgi:hypothetical protein
MSTDAIASAIDGAINDAFEGGRGFAPSSNGFIMSFTSEPRSPVESRTDEAFAALGYAGKVLTKAPPLIVADRHWSAWIDVRGTGFDQGDGHGKQFNLTGGVSYKLAPNVLIGLFGGYERFRFTTGTGDVNSDTNGHGGTFGGYAAWRLVEHWSIDGKVGWSHVLYNETVSDAVAGPVSGSFTGSRWFAGGGLTGNYRYAGWIFEPSARIHTLWERDSAFVDSLGTPLDARDFSVGRFSGGAKATYSWPVAPGVKLAPYTGVYGDYRFSTNSALPVDVLFLGVKDGWSARVTSGLVLTLPNGAMLSGGGQLSGIGAGYDIWSINGRAMWRF